MRARLATRLTLGLSIVVFAGAFAADAYSPPTTEAFLRGIKRYPYVAAAPRRDRIRAGVPRLTRCMPAADVRKLLGNPDFGFLAYKKSSSGTVADRVLWNYVLEKPTANETVPSSNVMIWFDNDFKLQAVTVHATPGLETNISRRTQACPPS
jgi:hypothetical protein